jgi:hypothetical protein
LDDVGTAGPFAKELPMDVKAWVLGTTEVRLEFAKAVEELEAVMLPIEDIAVGLSVGFEESLLVLGFMLVSAAPTSEAPVPEGSVVPTPRLEVGASELAKAVDEAFWGAPALELTADGVTEGSVSVMAAVADSGDMPTLLAVAFGAETMLEEVDMRPVAGPVMPRTGLVTDSGDVMAGPLEAVPAPETGLIPSVPGLIVGNDEEPSTSVIVAFGAPVNGVVLLRDSEMDVDIGGTVGIQPETWER